MTRTVWQVAVASVLIVGGAILWSRGREADRLAEARRALVTLRLNEAAGAVATRSAAEYWRGNFDAVDPGLDPLLAANAAYRSATEAGGDARTVVERLDAVVKQYAELLRADPANEDAAFNYEFVVRYRSAVAARGGAVPPSPDLDGLTLHGRAGAPPSAGDTRQFKVIVPMRPDERREAEEAGQAGRRIRKG